MNGYNVFVACIDSSGRPSIVGVTVQATQCEYDFGGHYNKARDMVEDLGYEDAGTCFDERDLGQVAYKIFVDLFMVNNQ